MNCIETEVLINQYLDKIIDESNEQVLFTHLAGCNVCREEFRLLNESQKMFNNSLEHFPEHLEKRIIESMKSKESNRKISAFRKPLPAFYLYAASIAIVFIAALYFLKINEFNKITIAQKNRMDRILVKEFEQEQHISRILNELPGVKVTAEINDPNLIQKEL